MPRKSPTKQQPPSSKAASAKPARGREPVASKSFTIAEFIRRNPMSKNTYFNLRAKGLGPREFRPTGEPSGIVLISEEAERDWIAACEKRNAKDVARGDEVRAERKAAKNQHD